MSDLRDLYQETILDHSKKPRNHRRVEGADHEAHGHNPLCGDRLTVYLKLEGDLIKDVAFEGAGCAISTASASMMTEALKGKTLDQMGALFDAFHDLVTSDHPRPGVPLGKLEAFSGVREFPVRVKCATLAWHTLRAALESKGESVSTE